MTAIFSKLRGLLRERNIDTEHLAKKLGLHSRACITHRLSGRTPWKMNEMYIILDLCKISHDQLHIYFPRDGKSVAEPKLRLAETKTA